MNKIVKILLLISGMISLTFGILLLGLPLTHEESDPPKGTCIGVFIPIGGGLLMLGIFLLIKYIYEEYKEDMYFRNK